MAAGIVSDIYWASGEDAADAAATPGNITVRMTSPMSRPIVLDLANNFMYPLVFHDRFIYSQTRAGVWIKPAGSSLYPEKKH
jgi:hypothetical protein